MREKVMQVLGGTLLLAAVFVGLCYDAKVVIATILHPIHTLGRFPLVLMAVVAVFFAGWVLERLGFRFASEARR